MPERPEGAVDRPVNVISYAGARGKERPLAVRVDREAIRVKAVRQMWVQTGLEPGEGVRRWFRVELEDARILTIYYDEALESWFQGPGDTRPSHG